MKQSTSVFVRPVLAAVLATALAPTAFAQEVGSSRLSFGASTLGATAEYAYRFHSDFSVRGVAGGLVGVSRNITIKGETYDSDIKPNGLGVMLDWHTGLGGLRFSGGVIYSTGEATGTTTQTGTFEIGGQGFTGTDTVDVRVRTKEEIAPAITVGYDYVFGNNMVLSGEVGGVFSGGYDVTATSTPGGVIATNNPGALANEAQQIEDSINGALGFYPYVSVMLGIQF